MFVVCAGMFVVGVSAEGGSNDEASETAEQHEANEAANLDEPAAAHDEGRSEGHDEADEEQILGFDTESPVAVIAAVAVSLAVAVGLWLRAQRWRALISVGLAVLFAVFDIAEIRHQLDESRTSLAVLAGVIAAGHVAAAATTGRSARAPGTP